MFLMLYPLVVKWIIQVDFHLNMTIVDDWDIKHQREERGGSLVLCLTRDRGDAGSSLTRGTALCPLGSNFILCLVLAQSGKKRPDMTENIWTGI